MIEKDLRGLEYHAGIVKKCPDCQYYYWDNEDPTCGCCGEPLEWQAQDGRMNIT